MPSSGKSKIGEVVAKKLDYQFLDLDMMVELREGASLIEVMNTKGAEYFRNMEYDFIKNLDPSSNIVISPAGSIIYQKEAMDWIVKNSYVFFLDAPLESIEARLNENPKAVQGLNEKGLKGIYDERISIYRKYAEFTLKTINLNVEEIANEIITEYSLREKSAELYKEKNIFT